MPDHQKFKRVGVVRWTAKQWEQLSAVSDEPMCDHSEYQRRTDRNIRMLRDRGAVCVEVLGNVAEYLAMCRDAGRPLDTRSRAAYAALLAQRASQH
jgi:hypothetical protein